MLLKEIADLLTLSTIHGDPNTEFADVETDSRKAKPGDLFICLPGAKFDGHDFADEVKRRGAVALIVSKPVDVGLPYLLVPDTRYAMAVAANHAYGYPSHDMKVIGITGTNGKTTTTHLIEAILNDQSRRCDMMGTIAMRIGGQTFEVKNTTQEALELQRNFRKMRDAGAEYCVMEVSSHALEMGRVKGVRFQTAVFTNLTQDHLDYHGSMDNYRDAKGLLFSRLGNTFDPERPVHAVLNADDPASAAYRRLTSAQVVTYGIDNDADVRAVDVNIGADGTSFELRTFRGSLPVTLRMVGKFSVYNALAAATATLLEGVPLERIRDTLERIPGVDGRFEPVFAGQPFLVIVDYAHTPDSLDNVLTAIRQFAKRNVITVFGCGGDRDKTKRPIMGRIAAEKSDYVIVTSDNPRSEDPRRILLDIEAGLKEIGADERRYALVDDRRTAIEKAVEMASPEDVVLIAGKGHETYQEACGVRTDFDDRLVAKDAIRRLKQ